MARWIMSAIVLLIASARVAVGEPDYSAWNALLAKYYEPARGMDYAASGENGGHCRCSPTFILDSITTPPGTSR